MRREAESREIGCEARRTYFAQSSAEFATDQPLDLADVEKFGQVLDVVCKACIVEPADLKPEELPSFDKQTIFNWANQAAGKLEPFRSQQNGDVESPFAVGDLPPATK